MTDSEIDAYAEQLYKAMKGSGTDEDTIIKISSQNPLSIRLKIRSRYKALYGQDLLEDFKSDLSGNFLKVEEGLYKNIYEYDADECYLAIKGLGTNEDTLIEIIGTRPPWMLGKIKEIYKIK